MSDVDRIIQEGLTYKSIISLANFEYSKALNSFWEAINLLFESIKHQSDSDAVKSKSLINNLLAQAEQCKSQLTPVRKIDPIVRILAPAPPLPEEYKFPSSPPHSVSFPPKVQTKSTPTVAKPVENERSDQPLEAMIETEIIDISRSITWDDIAGLASAKAMLREAVILPSQFPLVFTGIRAPPKGILLFGPPGTGKTLLAKALASQSSACFFSISSSTLTSRFVRNI